MSVAVTKAVEGGATGVVCASTGNTAASAAAYAARAGIEAIIVVAGGAAASSKLVQVRAVGGRIVEVDGTFADAYDEAARLAVDGIVHVNSTNDDRIEGQKTAAFEILEQLGGLPDVLALPYGGGGNTKAYARGFLEATGELPRFHPTEAERRADTVASAIRIVEPEPPGRGADRARRLRRLDRDRERRRAHRCVAVARQGGRALLRARLRGGDRRRWRAARRSRASASSA